MFVPGKGAVHDKKVEQTMFTVRFPVPTVKKSFISMASILSAVLALILSACGGSTQTTSTTPTVSLSNSNAAQQNDLGIRPESGLTVSLFAAGTSSYTAPDNLVADNGHIFIGYQNVTAKDCTDSNSSTVVEYNMDGSVVKTFSVPGHSDGMRADPSTHLLWVTSCEDANPKFVTIDPSSGTITPYTLAKTAHGGGYDDLYFLNGMTFMTASNPTLDSNGNNVKPALYKITLGNGVVQQTPILMGNATATDTITKKSVTLNLVDPDSLSVDTNGNLILVNQAGSQLITLSNPGTPQQKVSSTNVGSQLDDTVWIPTAAKGRLLVADGLKNKTFWISGNFNPGLIYTETPDDSGVAGVFGRVDPSTGIVAPDIIGFSKPTGMIFVPNS
jgi:hypothetical protein